MPRVGVYVLASLISGVSAALILASGPSYTEPRSPQSTAYSPKRGQSTYNGCLAGPCQIAYLNSAEDFCLWAPSQPVLSATGNTEHTLVAWCMKPAHGTRLIPEGAISGARLVITPAYVQITGVGDLSNINVPADGVASASGDRVHGLVFTRAYGQLEQIYDWTSFVSQERFCFRACNPSAAALTTCARVYDISGCSEHIPGKYDTGVLEDGIGDAPEVPSTLYQEALVAPARYSARSPSGHTTCDAQVARARRAVASTPGSTSSALVPSVTHSYYRSHRHSTGLTSSTTPMTIDTATTITFPTSSSTTIDSIHSTAPVSSDTPTPTPYSYSYSHIRSHWHSHTHRYSHHQSSTSLASVSSSFSPSSSTASSLSDPSSTSSATPSFTLTYSSLDLSSSGISTTTSTAPMSTSSFPSSSDGTSSLEVSSYQSSTPSSTSPPTSSQSSDVLTFTLSLSPSSVPTMSTATSSVTSQHSQTQLGSQCPPPSQNAGSVIPSPTSLLPLMLTILIIIISSSVGALVI